MSGFVVYGFKNGERRYYGGTEKKPLADREEAKALALRIAEQALLPGGCAQLVLVEPVEPRVEDIITGRVTAKSVVAAIDANLKSFYADEIEYASFNVRQRVIWDAARKAGVEDAVCALLRKSLPKAVRA